MNQLTKEEEKRIWETVRCIGYAYVYIAYTPDNKLWAVFDDEHTAYRHGQEVFGRPIRVEARPVLTDKE